MYGAARFRASRFVGEVNVAFQTGMYSILVSKSKGTCKVAIKVGLVASTVISVKVGLSA